MNKQRLVITGMSVITPIGDELDLFFKNLIAGKSAITKWHSFNTNGIYGKVGADLFDYPIDDVFDALAEKSLPLYYKKAKRLMNGAPFNEKLTIIAALKLMQDSGIKEWPYSPEDSAVVIAGHNLNRKYEFDNHNTFNDEPEFIEGLYALRGLDTDHAGVVSEMFNFHGSAYTVGAACASGNLALKQAVDEILYHDMEAAMLVAPVLDFSPLEFQGLSIMGAISYKSFNEAPAEASRPYDLRREGFVPAHGCACLLVEKLEAAKARGAKIHAEIIGVESSADGNHLPEPSAEGQSKLIRRLLKRYDLQPSDIDFISAHATSTPLGDLTEINAIKHAFGDHAYKLKINAPKSMLGHTCWSSGAVEAVATILQMQQSKLHPSINIKDLDPKIDLDICRDNAVDWNVNYCLNNSFGFGGLNCIAIFKKYE